MPLWGTDGAGWGWRVWDTSVRLMRCSAFAVAAVPLPQPLPSLWFQLGGSARADIAFIRILLVDNCK